MLIDDETGGLSREAIGIALAIHKKYGPGLFEKAYCTIYATSWGPPATSFSASRVSHFHMVSW